ncbi:conserved hypothetical protein [Burkholderia pseudomallei MSHR346]|nr:conserved hypothetical protein [Burkholderia pseudomallei 576]EEP49900.1 conserved hypothetical protein [Burkholderia pseudomallei MSHR346]
MSRGCVGARALVTPERADRRRAAHRPVSPRLGSCSRDA